MALGQAQPVPLSTPRASDAPPRGLESCPWSHTQILNERVREMEVREHKRWSRRRGHEVADCATEVVFDTARKRKWKWCRVRESG